MPPFQYRPVDYSEGNVIPQLVQQGGAIQAQALQQAAAARAQGTIGAGQAWGQGLTNLGNTVANIPQMYAQRQEAQIKSQMMGMQLAQIQQEVKSQQAIRKGWADPANRNDDGTVSPDKMETWLQNNGDFGAWQQYHEINLKTKTENAKLDQITADTTKTQQQIAGQRQKALGTLAYYTAQQMDKNPTDPLHVRDTFLAGLLSGASGTTPTIDPNTASQLALRTARAGPDQLRAIVEQQIDPELRADLDEKEGKAAKTRAETANLQAYGRTTAPLPPTSRPSTFLLDGHVVQGSYIPGRGDTPGRYISPTGEDVTSRQRPITAPVEDLPSWALDDSHPTGADANTLDPKLGMTPNGLYQATLNYLQTGKYPTMGTRSASDPTIKAQRTAIQSKVGAIAAAAGMSQPQLEAAYKSNSASLTQQQKNFDAVSAFMANADRNTDLLSKLTARIPDLGSAWVNKPLRQITQQGFGDVDLSQFRVYVQSIQNEYGKILANPNLTGQLTDSARKEAEALVDPNATVPQILGSIDALKAEGHNRQISMGEQIGRTMQRMQVGAGPQGGGGGGTYQKDDRRQAVDATGKTAWYKYDGSKWVREP